jgi:hypothetical protein
MPVDVAVGDFNGDRQLDLAVVINGSETVSILLGHGDGSFSAPTDFPAGFGPASVAVGDFNGDGRLDLAVASDWYDNVSILRNCGGFVIAARTLTAVAGITAMVGTRDRGVS